MITELLEQTIYYKPEEKDFVFSILSKVFMEVSERTDEQKEFVRLVGEYLNVVEPKLETKYEVFDNVENQEIHDFMMYFIYQLLYIQDDEFEFEDNDDVLEIFDHISVKRSAIKKIKEQLIPFVQLKEIITNLLYFRKTTVSQEQVMASISEMIINHVTSKESSLIYPKFNSEREFNDMFEYECRGVVNRHYEDNGKYIISEYVKSLQSINEKIIKSYEVEEETAINDILEDFKELSFALCKNHDYEIDYDQFSEHCHKITMVDMHGGNSKWTKSKAWGLIGDARKILDIKVESIMLKIETELYKKYIDCVDEMVEYYMSNYTLVRRDIDVTNITSMICDAENLDEKINLLDRVKEEIGDDDFKTYLYKNFIENMPFTDGAETVELIGYNRGYVYFYTIFKNDDQFLTRNRLGKLCSVDLFRNYTLYHEIELENDLVFIVPNAVAHEEKLYFLLTFLRREDDNYTFLMNFDSKVNDMNQMKINDERVILYDSYRLLQCERFLYINGTDIHLGNNNYLGNKEQEIIVENVIKINSEDCLKSITDDELINKFKNLDSDLIEILENEVNNDNGLAMYMLGELYFHDTILMRGRDEATAKTLWEKGRKINPLCLARDLINNQSRYNDNDVNMLINELSDDCSLNKYMKYILVINNYINVNCKFDYLNEAAEEGNWLSYYSLGLAYYREGNNELALEQFMKCIENGIFDPKEKIKDLFFDDIGIDYESYKKLKNLVRNTNGLFDYTSIENKIKNINGNVSKFYLYDLDRDYNSYYIDGTKTFSSISAAKSYAERQLEKQCQYIKDTFKLDCEYYGGTNGSFLNFINENKREFKLLYIDYMIFRAYKNACFKDFSFRNIYEKITDISVRVGKGINVNNFYASNYIVHDITEWGDTGFFAKKEYSNYPSTGSLDSDFSMKKDQFSKGVQAELIDFYKTIFTFDDINDFDEKEIINNANFYLEKAEELYLSCQYDEAFMIFEVLAKNNIAKAMYFLGEYYHVGKGEVAVDKKISDSWRILGKEKGDILSTLKNAYLSNVSPEQKDSIIKETLPKLLELAENGDVFAQYELSSLYKEGNGVEQSDTKYLYWANKAIEQGDAVLANRVGLYYDGLNDYVNANKYFIKASSLGSSWGSSNYAYNILKGLGVQQSNSAAIEWYQKSAELGNSDSMNRIGLFYWNGEGVSQDLKIANNWFKKAAEIGFNYGMSNLGYSYKNGYGCSQDDYKSYEWYKKAAKCGHAGAMNSVALAYDSGRGVEKDLKQAFVWFKKSAENEDASGMSNLGWCYHNGDGCDVDHELAKEWLRKSAEAGNETAKKHLLEWYDIQI